MDISLWTFNQLHNHINESPLIETDFNSHIVAGFEFLGTDLLLDFTMCNSNLVKCKIIAATIDSKVVGIATLTYESWKANFDHYKSQIWDVHEDFQRQGISKKMLGFLDIQSFLEGEVLELSRPISKAGEKFCQWEQTILQAKQYSLVPNNYSGNKPTTTGKIIDRLFL